MKPFQSLIQSRRSIRKFDATKPISPDDLRFIIEAGIVAPSAKNGQPYRFMVLSTEEAREKAYTCYERSWFKEAAAIILIVGDNDTAWVYQDEEATSIYTDAAIATTQMMLQAWELGIGSCWICAFDRKRCADLFELNWDKEKPLNILALGYPATDPKALPHKRKPFDQLVEIL